MVGLFCSFAVALASAQERVYVPYSGIISGTAGAEPVELLVTNRASAAMVCTAALAHWYSENLGEIPPQGTLPVTLWHDPKTGVINLLNASNDRMPIEAIWCGLAGNMSETRSRLLLPFAIGPASHQLLRICAQGAGAQITCAPPKG